MFPRPPQRVFDAEDGTGGGGGGTGDIAERPEYMPEKFWDNATGTANVEGLATSYTHSEAELGRIVRGGKTAEEWRNETRTDVQNEFDAERNKDRPESADGYAFNVPELPEGVEWEADENDPMLAWWRETAHANGFNQEKFDAGIAEYVKMQVGNLPDYEAELAALGENGKARAEAVNLWSKANLSEEGHAALERFTTNADGIKMLEEIVKLTKGAKVNNGGDTVDPNPAMTKQQVKNMQNDPRYYDPLKRDPEYVAQVEAAWKKVAPGVTVTAPQNSSG